MKNMISYDLFVLVEENILICMTGKTLYTVISGCIAYKSILGKKRKNISLKIIKAYKNFFFLLGWKKNHKFMLFN